MTTPTSREPQQLQATLRKNLNAPVVFADHVASLGIGSFVSKVTFAAEELTNGDPQMSEVVSIHMPTSLLLEFATNVLEAFRSPDLRASLNVSSEQFLRKLDAVALKS